MWQGPWGTGQLKKIHVYQNVSEQYNGEPISLKNWRTVSAI